jgi:hypothetical protein
MQEGALGSVMIKALCSKPEGRWFETWWSEYIFFNLPNLSDCTIPGVYSATKRNDYQKQKNNVSEE